MIKCVVCAALCCVLFGCKLQLKLQNRRISWWQQHEMLQNNWQFKEMMQIHEENIHFFTVFVHYNLLLEIQILLSICPVRSNDVNLIHFLTILNVKQSRPKYIMFIEKIAFTRFYHEHFSFSLSVGQTSNLRILFIPYSACRKSK